jgi:hypothetical protein
MPRWSLGRPRRLWLAALFAGCNLIGAERGEPKAAPKTPAAPPAAPVAATLPKSAPAAPVMAAEAFSGYREVSGADGEAVKSWLGERVKKARAGQRELLRIPLSESAAGCACPAYYAGLDQEAAKKLARSKPTPLEAGVFLALKGVKEAELPPAKAGKASAPLHIVEGYFTGKLYRTDATGAPLSEVEEAALFSRDTSSGAAQYVLPELQLLRSRRPDGGSDDKRLQVMLTGEAATSVEPFDDGKPWLIVVATISDLDDGTAGLAEEYLAELRAAGFSGAESFDSRKAPKLFCCSEIVVAGRYATEAEARRSLKAARRKLGGAYLARGW